MITGQVIFPSVSLDEKDLQILRVLQENARLSYRDVAAKINLSPTPTQERIKRMEKEGVIMQYGALLNAKKVGKGIIALCQVTIKKQNREDVQVFVNKILSFEEVTECYVVAGDFDYSLKIVTTSMEAYHHFFINKLNPIDIIIQTRSTFVMDVVKQTHVIV